ncbi:MAG: zf-TFIIB domain-containing protein [Deltaproteobacteria bacterium]|nr:zf-TFIIB domain-containing protein [Nannocystaceae bacterium]
MLRATQAHGAWVLVCDTCWGLWIDHASLGHISPDALRGATIAPAEGLACPLCRTTLQACTTRGITIDRCIMHGWWFDHTEVEHLLGHTPGVAGGAIAAAAVAAVVATSVAEPTPQPDGTDTTLGAVEMVDASLPVVEIVAETADATGVVAGIGDAVGAIFDFFS